MSLTDDDVFMFYQAFNGNMTFPKCKPTCENKG